jgi:AcrR family transcriptional regulator
VEFATTGATAVRLIGRDGLEAATTQAVAAQCGWSTGVPRHYFRNKDELFYAALSELERLNLQRFENARREATGYAAIRAAVEATTCGDADETRVWISFLARASGDASTCFASAPEHQAPPFHAVTRWRTHDSVLTWRTLDLACRGAGIRFR